MHAPVWCLVSFQSTRQGGVQTESHSLNKLRGQTKIQGVQGHQNLQGGEPERIKLTTE